MSAGNARGRRTRRERAPEPETVTLRLGGPAAGGTCVAHAESGTWFVRLGLPGELVEARVTGRRRSGRIGFAAVTRVIEPSPHRVVAPCALADICGGCDLQHVAPDFQRQWKAQVLRDQLQRIGRFDAIGGRPLDAVLDTVTTLPLTGWRTRFDIDTDDSGRACFHAHRSAQLVPVAHCPVVAESLQAAFTHQWEPGERVSVSESTTAPTVAPLVGDAAVPAGWRMASTAVRTAAGRSWRVAVDGFWQAHVDAPDTLVAAVRRAVAPAAGAAGPTGEESAPELVDLYSGVGLFAGALVAGKDSSPGEPAAGMAGFAQVTAVEGDPQAVRLARRNLHDLPEVQLVHADVKEWVASAAGTQALTRSTAAVLDPPRVGAGATVIDAIALSGAEVVCYVACDGASLARDARRLVDSGWQFDTLEAFDLFGMSGHIEAVARFIRG